MRVSHRSLVFVTGLTVCDYLLWNWSLAGNHVALALVAGFTLVPLAIVCALALALALTRALARSTRRPARRQPKSASVSAAAPPSARTHDHPARGHPARTRRSSRKLAA